MVSGNFNEGPRAFYTATERPMLSFYNGGIAPGARRNMLRVDTAANPLLSNVTDDIAPEAIDAIDTVDTIDTFDTINTIDDIADDQSSVATGCSNNNRAAALPKILLDEMVDPALRNHSSSLGLEKGHSDATRTMVNGYFGQPKGYYHNEVWAGPGVIGESTESVSNHSNIGASNNGNGGRRRRMSSIAASSFFAPPSTSSSHTQDYANQLRALQLKQLEQDSLHQRQLQNSPPLSPGSKQRREQRSAAAAAIAAGFDVNFDKTASGTAGFKFPLYLSSLPHSQPHQSLSQKYQLTPPPFVSTDSNTSDAPLLSLNCHRISDISNCSMPSSLLQPPVTSLPADYSTTKRTSNVSAENSNGTSPSNSVCLTMKTNEADFPMLIRERNDENRRALDSYQGWSSTAVSDEDKDLFRGRFLSLNEAAPAFRNHSKVFGSATNFGSNGAVEGHDPKASATDPISVVNNSFGLQARRKSTIPPTQMEQKSNFFTSRQVPQSLMGGSKKLDHANQSYSNHNTEYSKLNNEHKKLDSLLASSLAALNVRQPSHQPAPEQTRQNQQYLQQIMQQNEPQFEYIDRPPYSKVVSDRRSQYSNAAAANSSLSRGNKSPVEVLKSAQSNSLTCQNGSLQSEQSLVSGSINIARADKGSSSLSSTIDLFDMQLENLVSNIYPLCKEQLGCRYLQKQLDTGRPEYVDIIFHETHDHIPELMMDSFGNYLCQKLFEHCDEEKRAAILYKISPDLVKIALNTHGTRAIQKMIEHFSSPRLIRIFQSSAKDHVVTLIKDLNGNHIIQKCLQKLKSEHIEFIVKTCADQCLVVGSHRHGCCVIQRCLPHASPTQREQLIDKIIENSLSLVQNAFGNYVVQYILDLNQDSICNRICECFRGYLVALSVQKFSSNVIEKCIRVASKKTRRNIIDELIMGGDLDVLIRDSFGNYVVQTALDEADADQKSQIISVISPMLPFLKNNPHGRRIASKILNKA